MEADFTFMDTECTGAMNLYWDAQNISSNNDRIDRSVANKAQNNVMDQTLLKNEDMRISKIIRSLLNDNPLPVMIELCKKLEGNVLRPVNHQYICSSLEIILENMVDVLKTCPIEIIEQVTNLIGLIGYVGRTSFNVIMLLIRKNYASSVRTKTYLLKAFEVTLRHDIHKGELLIYSEGIVTMLKDCLENAGTSDDFIVACEAIAEFAKYDKFTFKKHFADVVDIIIGWHLEDIEAKKLRDHCAYLLQEFSQFFYNDLNLSFGLLTQFVEDITVLSVPLLNEPVETTTASIMAAENAILRITGFVGVYNSVLKSILMNKNFVAATNFESLFAQSLIIMKNIFHKLLTTKKTDTYCLLFININEFWCIYLQYLFEAIDLNVVQQFIELQLLQFSNYNVEQQLSTLYLVLWYVRKCRNALSMQFVELFFGNNPSYVNLQACLSDIKASIDGPRYQNLLSIYQEILLIKNVPILQRVYKYLINDINTFIETLLGNFSGSIIWSKFITAESNLNFIITSLAALATEKSSIISMFACNPSILELLIINCRAADADLWDRSSMLQQNLFELLVKHCENNHNYLASSSLLNSNDNNDHIHDKLQELKQQPQPQNQQQSQSQHASPSAEHFTMILNFLSKILAQEKYVCDENLNIILKWLINLLKACQQYAKLLYKNYEFMKICAMVSGTLLERSPHLCADCIEILIDYEPINYELLLFYRKVILKQLNTVNDELLFIYSKLHSKLPLNMQITPVSMKSNCQNNMMRLYRTSKNYGKVREKFFVPFLETLDKFDGSSVIEFSLMCFYQRIIFKGDNEKPMNIYLSYVSNSSRMLVNWLQFELARYLIEQKLRTPLGKAQDTFLAIEAIVMKYSHILTNCPNLAARNIGGVTGTHPNINTKLSTLEIFANRQCNMRTLLEFLEVLEKLIYNAAQGTAFAYNPTEKLALQFFKLNVNICQNWFMRMRQASTIIAIYCMKPDVVIRYSEEILRILKPTDAGFLSKLVNLTWALLKCNEHDTLEGLFIWAHSKTGKNFQWIQHAAEQAAGQKELALAGYKAVLNNYSVQLQPVEREFILAQIIDCLYYTGQWSNLKAFKENLTTGGNASQLNIYTESKYYSVNWMENLLAQFETNTIGNEELCKDIYGLTVWPRNLCENTNQQNKLKIKKNLLQELENVCLHCMIEAKDIKSGAIANDLNKALSIAWRDSLLNDSMADRELIELTLLKYVAQKLNSNRAECNIEPLINDQELYNTYNACSTSSTLIKWLAWSQLMEMHLDKRFQNALYLNIAENARKEGNYQCCQRMLERFFKRRNYTKSLNEIIAQLLNERQFVLNINDTELLRAYCELAKWLNAQEEPHEIESIKIGAALCLHIQEQSKKTEIALTKTETATLIETVTNCPNINADILLTLADWLTQRSLIGNPINEEVLQDLLAVMPNLKLTKEHLIPKPDLIIGRLIYTSCKQQTCPDDAWISYGNWCYRWGKRIIETNNIGNNGNMIDIQKVRESIGKTINVYMDTSTIYHLIGIFNKYQHNCIDDVDDIYTNMQHNLTTDVLKQELKSLTALLDQPDDVIDKIINLLRQSSKDIYILYEEAARAYFHYLNLKATDTATVPQISDSNMVTTTLRLLRLIVKHANVLQDVLEDGLKTTPIHSWKVIIPQMFSRLNHHEPYVRKSVSDLLCRLAVKKPQLIIFPAVVGANREQNSIGDYQPNDVINTQLTHSYCSLLSKLSEQQPQIVTHVQLLVTELKRICLLWDEFWVHSLSQLHTKYLLRINAIEMDFASDDVRGKNRKFNDEYRQQIIADFLNIKAFTDREPVSEYEQLFRERFQRQIEQTLNLLRVKKYPNSWNCIKHLYNLIQQNPLRGNNLQLRLQHISPALAIMSNTNILMPGVDPYDLEPVYISHIECVVRVLATKTKPKKVTFMGSNGKKYNYLFKGMEDLHLDERIMQFLSISNSIMSSKSESRTAGVCFRAQHYSVIPLGPQSGLISWVDDVLPIFAVYKKWQQRSFMEKTLQKKLHNTKENDANRSPLVGFPMRITDLFNAKLKPKLIQHNIREDQPRRHWPVAVLREVLAELMAETPNDLIAKEIWCHAINCEEWRKSVRRFTMSLAVMSVIGYIIGLGDRHLDNILINYKTGEILHIDYNVCFEKGKTLRIPEKVPFRLTQNLVSAMGITGVEGVFRTTCEYVLKLLRKERETLLTLLEAFVYDPLVDWTLSEENSTSKRVIANKNAATNLEPKKTGEKYMKDWEQTRQRISSKLKEMKNYWLQYTSSLNVKLTNISKYLRDLINLSSELDYVEEQRDALFKQTALIREIESLDTAIGSHVFNTAMERYATRERNSTILNGIQDELNFEPEAVQTVLNDYYNCVKDVQCIETIEDNIKQQKLHKADWYEDYQLFNSVLKINKNKLKPYEILRHEIDKNCTLIYNLSQNSIQYLKQYVAIIEFYPEDKYQLNKFVIFHKSYTKYKDMQTKQEIKKNTNENNLNMHNNKYAILLNRQQIIDEANTMLHVYNALCNEHNEKSKELLCYDINDKLTDNIKQAISDITNQRATLEGRFILTQSLTLTIQQSQLSFSNLEKHISAHANFDILDYQMNYVNTVLEITELILAKPINLSACGYLRELQYTLNKIYNLKYAIQIDLAKIVYKLFLIGNNRLKIDALCNLGAKCMAKQFWLLNDKMSTNERNLDAIDEKFYLYLTPIFELFNEFKSNLNHLLSIAQNVCQRLMDKKQIEFVPKHIQCDEPINFDNETFFNIILEALTISKQFDVRNLMIPINNFINFISHNYLNGLASILVQNLCFDLCGQKTITDLSAATLTKEQLLTEKLYQLLQKKYQIIEEKNKLQLINDWIKFIQLAGSAHYWAFENILMKENINYNYVILKKNLLDQMHNNVQQQETILETLLDLQKRIDHEVVCIENQKTNWNRNHIKSFMQKEQQRKNILQENMNLSRHIIHKANLICQFEIAACYNNDTYTKLVTTIENWNIAYANWYQSYNAITSIEIAIIELLKPEGNLNKSWLKAINHLLEERNFNVQHKLTQLQNDLMIKQKRLYTSGIELQSMLTNTLFNEIQNLTNMVNKSERNIKYVPSDMYALSARLRDVQSIMKLYFDKLNELPQLLTAVRENIDNDVIMKLKNNLEDLMTENINVHDLDEFFCCSEEYLQESSNSKLTPYEMVTKGDLNNTALTEQKRNVHGVSVWKRIRSKLEGRDPEAVHRSSVTEQVDYIIKESMNLDNLAVLYEGWTPWV